VKSWPIPKSRAIGFFSDSALYADVLHIGIQTEYFTKKDLQKYLVNHVKGLTFIDTISDTAIDNLIRELIYFKWIDYYFRDTEKAQKNYEVFSANKSSSFFCITPKGKILYEYFGVDRDKFFDELILELNNIYTIPGWFVQRLWDLNIGEQGEIIIPSPPKKWNPDTRRWDDNKWNDELKEQVERTYLNVKKYFPNSYIPEYDVWLEEIKKRWQEIALTKPRKDNLPLKHVYTPRKRLALAMKESAVKMMFANLNPKNKINDFDGLNFPLLPRTYSYWCSRLEEIGLLNYTDYHPLISGRIIYPVCSFKPFRPSEDFRIITEIKNTNNEYLCLFRPSWEKIKSLFVETLYEEYKKIYLHVKSLYVSIQDVRDSVCRVLRLSNFMFDKFIEIAANESINGRLGMRIAIETDVREDQRKAHQRRPVYVNNKFVSLIAITK
jgi:hypothetical protein